MHLRIFTLLSIHYKQSWSDTAYMFGCKINCLHHHNASNGGSAELLIENLIKHNTCDIIIKPDPRSTTQSHFSTYLASGLHCDRLWAVGSFLNQVGSWDGCGKFYHKLGWALQGLGRGLATWDFDKVYRILFLAMQCCYYCKCLDASQVNDSSDNCDDS